MPEKADMARCAMVINRFVTSASQQPTARLLVDLARRLEAQGCSVERISAEYSALSRDDRSAPAVHGRLAGLLVILWRGLRARKPHVIVSLSDPPMVLFIARLLGLWHRSPVVYWCHDVYPDVLRGIAWPAPVTPLLAPMIRLLAWLHGRLMRGCRERIVPAACLAQALRRHDGASPTAPPITVLPNWPEPNVTPQPMPTSKPLTVLYSGHYGHGHDLTDLVQAARLLANTAPGAVEFKIALTPRGLARWQRLHGADSLASNVPRNMTVTAAVPMAALADHLAQAHIHAVSIKDMVSGAILPSKAMASFRLGRPVLLFGGAGSSLEQDLAASDAGITIPPGSAQAAAAWLSQLAADPDALAKLARNAARHGQVLAAKDSVGQLTNLVFKAMRQPIVQPHQDPPIAANQNNELSPTKTWESGNA